ncbi:LIM domain binding [Branchiostoma belcheri]|nr:LIM domain binding [Branchiostoma belcheri]
MAALNREQERQRLTNIIRQWNANRLDLFELSEPNEDLEFHGVMRFFHQDTDSKERVTTKCIRVSSTATTAAVIETLVEKFRPDMRMLTTPVYGLYEVHANGEERRLDDNEKPLLVQLNWNKDDREGRFLLKREDNLNVSTPTSPQGEESAAEKLYQELPESGFTRSISNPEAVMRRRRQQKLERRNFSSALQTLLLSTNDTAAFVVKESLEKYGLDKRTPGLLPRTGTSTWRRIGNNLSPIREVIPAATCRHLALTFPLHHSSPPPPPAHSRSCAGFSCSVQLPPGSTTVTETGGWGRELILDDDDCPLQILMDWPAQKGTLAFQLKRRPSDARGQKRKPKKSKSSSKSSESDSYQDMGPVPQDRLPFMVELNPDGSEMLKPRLHRLQPNVTEVGSERSSATSGQYLQLFSPNVKPRHCVIANMEGVVTVTPTNHEAETYVNGQRIYETTMLQHNSVVRFGKMHTFRFCEPVPVIEKSQGGRPDVTQSSPRRGPAEQSSPSSGQANFETTFDVDGHIETVTSPVNKTPPRGLQERPVDVPPEHMPPVRSNIPFETVLPASIEYRDSTEEQLLSQVISEVNGAAVQFKLAPTYTLYMAARHRIASDARNVQTAAERLHRLNSMTIRVASMISRTIQEGSAIAGVLAFWMANASELLHFLKMDRDTSRQTQEAQGILGDAVQMAFRYLVQCMTRELRASMPAFLDESSEADQEDEESLTVKPSDADQGRFWMLEAGWKLGSFLDMRDLPIFLNYHAYHPSNSPGYLPIARSASCSPAVPIFCCLGRRKLRDKSRAKSEPVLNAQSETTRAVAKSCEQLPLETDDGDHSAHSSERSFRTSAKENPARISGRWLSPNSGMKGGKPNIGDVLNTLSSAMSLLRRCRVNAALTIQLFSQLFHFINMWLFNKVVMEPHLGLCTRMWGLRLKRRLGRVELWAEKQGLELAADCHLCRVIQAAHLLQAPKHSAEDIASISSTCFKLNSMQLRALLEQYRPDPNEPRIPQDLIESVVSVAENTADELTRSDGGDVRLEEDSDLQLPFLLPEDGYSCDIVRGVPTGLQEFLDPLVSAGLVRMNVHPNAPGVWTIYFTPEAQEAARNMGSPGEQIPKEKLRSVSQQVHPEGHPSFQGSEQSLHTPESRYPPTPKGEAEVIDVSFSKNSSGMGLSIVAAKEKTERWSKFTEHLQQASSVLGGFTPLLPLPCPYLAYSSRQGLGILRACGPNSSAVYVSPSVYRPDRLVLSHPEITPKESQDQVVVWVSFVRTASCVVFPVIYPKRRVPLGPVFGVCADSGIVLNCQASLVNAESSGSMGRCYAVNWLMAFLSSACVNIGRKSERHRRNVASNHPPAILGKHPSFLDWSSCFLFAQHMSSRSIMQEVFISAGFMTRFGVFVASLKLKCQTSALQFQKKPQVQSPDLNLTHFSPDTGVGYCLFAEPKISSSHVCQHPSHYLTPVLRCDSVQFPD